MMIVFTSDKIFACFNLLQPYTALEKVHHSFKSKLSYGLKYDILSFYMKYPVKWLQQYSVHDLWLFS